MKLTPQQQITLIEEALYHLPTIVLRDGFGLCRTLETACKKLGEPYSTWVNNEFYPLTDLGLVNPNGEQDNGKHWFQRYDYESRYKVLEVRLNELLTEATPYKNTPCLH